MLTAKILEIGSGKQVARIVVHQDKIEVECEDPVLQAKLYVFLLRPQVTGFLDPWGHEVMNTVLPGDKDHIQLRLAALPEMALRAEMES